MRSIVMTMVLVSTIFTHQFAQAQSESNTEHQESPKPTAKKKKAKQKQTPAPVEDAGSVEESAGVQPGSSSRSNAMFLRQNGHPSGGRIEVTPLIGTYNLIGYDVGVMGAFRILDKGFIPMLNNSISIEAGLDFASWTLYSYTHRVVSLTADGRWDFHLSRLWTVYAASGLAIRRQWTSWKNEDSSGESAATNNLGIHVRAGGAMHFSDKFALRLDYDAASIARVGTTFSF
jgi:opacity protein-like surface antigen